MSTLSERFPTILVLGSNSFSGAWFCRYAMMQGCSVQGVSRSPQPASVFLPHTWQPQTADQLQFAQLDINHDVDALVDLLHDVQPQAIVNFAGQGMVAESWGHPDHWMQTNVVATTMLFHYLKDLDFVERYLHFTTPEVYGSVSGEVTEEQSFNPSTPYAVSRAAGDMSLQTYVRQFRLPAVLTRAANVYGPGQQLYRIIPKTVLNIRLGKRLPLHGGGYSERSFIHIEDVCAALERVLVSGEIGETYHIATRDTVSIRQLVALICEKMAVDFDQSVDSVGDRMGKDAAYLLDTGKIRESLGWQDELDLEAGIDSVIQWVDEHLEQLKTEPHEYQHKS